MRERFTFKRTLRQLGFFYLSSYIKNKNKTYVQSFEYMMASSKPYFIWNVNVQKSQEM